MKTLICLAIATGIFSTSGCISEARKAELAAREAQEARSAQIKKALSDSIAAAVLRFETEAQRIQPARRRCKSTYDTFLKDLGAHGARNLMDPRISYESAALKATANAMEVFDDVKEKGLEAMNAILDYSFFVRESVNELISLRIKYKMETAKTNFDYCQSNWEVTKGVFEDLNVKKNTR